MGNAKSKFLTLSLIAGICSCTHEIYRPNPVFIPCITEKYQLIAEANVGTSGLNTNVAFSPVNNFYGLVNVTNPGQYSNPDSNSYYKAYFQSFDFGLGFYYPIIKNENEWFVNISSGYGYGKGQNYYYSSELTSAEEGGSFGSGNYRKFFIQPSIIFKPANFIELSLAIRASYMHYYGARYVNYNYYLNKPNYEFSNITQNDLVFEPVGQVRLGYKYIYFTAQAGFSISKQLNSSFNKPSYVYENVIDYYPFIINIGISIDLPFNSILKSLKNIENEN